MSKRTYPEENEEWSRNGELYFTYRIHSRTSDGWIRYQHTNLGKAVYPMYCMPTDEFMKRFQKVERNV